MLQVCLVNVVWRTISWIELLHRVGQAWHPVRLCHSYQRVLAHTLPAKLVVQTLHRLTVHEKLRVSLPIVEPEHAVSMIPIRSHSDTFKV